MGGKTSLLRIGYVFFLGSIALLNAEPTSAATLCVNQNPSSGCYATIGAAVAAATAGDTIQVVPGQYAEDVHIQQPLALIGAGANWTTIDAKGLANGVFIDGEAGSGQITPGHNTLIGVTVSGFTVQNANFEGILVANASNVTLWGNRVIGNNRGLDISNMTCPNIPVFETNEGDDCGEGIHLTGVDHSTVANNMSEKNSGGILLSDDTGPTNANVIQGNEVQDNPFDCGITLASHDPATITGSSSSFGVYDNTIANNAATENGFQVPGAGAGVGLFAPGPNNQTYGNVVVGNRLTNNGLPGVAIHNHAPTNNINLNDNVITGNYIAGNGSDTDVETTPSTAVPTGISLLGTSAISGTLITLNQVEKESIDIAVNNAMDGVVVAHLNNLVGQSAIGVANLGSGSVDATQNWWGCVAGPGRPAAARSRARTSRPRLS